MDLVYFAWGCFRDFVSRPGGSPPKPRSGHPRSLARSMGTLSAFRRRPWAMADRSLFELRRTSRFAHPAILGLRVRRQRGGAVAERALHHHRVEPAAEFEADAGALFVRKTVACLARYNWTIATVRRKRSASRRAAFLYLNRTVNIDGAFILGSWATC